MSDQILLDRLTSAAQQAGLGEVWCGDQTLGFLRQRQIDECRRVERESG